MTGSRERVRAIIRGVRPDRAALYDVLRNDAVLSHFFGAPGMPPLGIIGEAGLEALSYYLAMREAVLTYQ